MLSLEEVDLRNPRLIEDVLAPDLGERLEKVIGDAERVVNAVKGASSLLQSGDGLTIATSMAGVIDAFTGWLRGQIEGDSALEQANLAVAQDRFVGPPSPRWMWRQRVGGPPASQARTKLGLKWPSERVLAQWEPGAVYIFPRIGWDVVRRSFARTDLPNVFDEGQRNLVWTTADRELVTCLNRVADYWEGRGCGYHPGEEIQLSAGTWPYVSGRQVQSWSGLATADMAGHYIALHTPCAIHVLTDARPVDAIYRRWKKLVIDPLPRLKTEGQSDNGVYVNPDGSIHVQGADSQTVYITVDGTQWVSDARAIQTVTASFLGFFHLREAVLRDWQYVAPSAQAVGLDSADPRIRARAAGGQYVPEPTPAPEPAPAPHGEPTGGAAPVGAAPGVNGDEGGGGGAAAALLVFGGVVAAAGYALTQRRYRRRRR